MTKVSTDTATPESIALAAAALRGDVEVAKANPVEAEVEAADTEVVDVAKADAPKEEAETEEVAKAEEPATDNEEDKQDVAKAIAAVLPGLVKDAVAELLAPLSTEIAEVRKSLSVVEGSTQATLDFQSATTGILTSLKGEVEEQREVQKSVAATVEAVAQQPAGRRGALGVESVEVAKAAAVAPSINLEPLREWVRAEGYDTTQRVTFIREAEAGNYSNIPHDVRKAMGVEQ